MIIIKLDYSIKRGWGLGEGNMFGRMLNGFVCFGGGPFFEVQPNPRHFTY